ncbi:MAG: glycoside hydrolase family 15 protein [Planctomycetota bacterium]|jgi:GH15 family glucan-1,4-alpha-glucosidase
MIYQPIENYGVIGDLNTVALVGMDGSIDFMCFPRFDSPTIFAALLDHEKGGRFQIQPSLKEARCKQLYLPDTNILITRFLSEEGVAEISDFMTVGDQDYGQNLVRRVKCVRGDVHFKMLLAPRFDYARAEHSVEQNEDKVLFISKGPDKSALRLHSDVPVQIKGGDAFAEFSLREKETATFILESVDSGKEACCTSRDYVSRAFKDTMNFWQRWIGRSTYRGRWREMVNRSALTLKMLISREHGSVVAAPTFGLPEEMGGERNWDYRYTWIRDASFTLYALIRLGYTEEAGAFMHWIEARCGELNPDGSLQIMYGIDGRHDLIEKNLMHLEGYKGSKPVRIGNGAYDQLQLDIYGELMDSVYLYDKYGDPISYDLWTNLVRLLEWVCKNWRLEDEGIWEVRGGKQEFLYSRLMCWVALDRGIRLAQKRSYPAPLDQWQKERNIIHQEIFTKFWNPEREAFVQSLGSDTVDAANLLMPLVRFISPIDPRWISTMEVMKTDLEDDSLVYRYRTDTAASDGLAGEEGTFCMCSFWYVEALARMGDLHKARFYFEKMLGYANHLGLYAEELDRQGRHLGNFPQAFTHLALISAAFDLDRRLEG